MTSTSTWWTGSKIKRSAYGRRPRRLSAPGIEPTDRAGAAARGFGPLATVLAACAGHRERAAATGVELEYTADDGAALQEGAVHESQTGHAQGRAVGRSRHVRRAPCAS